MLTAYLLIQAEPGTSATVRQQIADMPGVSDADMVAGYYDVIVTARAGDVPALGELVAQAGAVPGVTRCMVCHRTEGGSGERDE